MGGPSSGRREGGGYRTTILHPGSHPIPPGTDLWRQVTGPSPDPDPRQGQIGLQGYPEGGDDPNPSSIPLSLGLKGVFAPPSHTYDHNRAYVHVLTRGKDSFPGDPDGWDGRDGRTTGRVGRFFCHPLVLPRKLRPSVPVRVEIRGRQG